MDASWESVVGGGGTAEDSESGVADTTTQLDAKVRASGYYSTQANRDLELYYFESGPKRIASAIVEGEEDEDEGNSNDDEDSNDESDGQGDSFPRNANDPDGPPGTPLEPSSAPDGSALNDDDDDDSLSEHHDGAVEEDLSIVDDVHRMRLEARAKTVVHKQIEAQKRKSRKQGAFRKPNSNKSFVKGKRIHAEAY